MKYLVFSFALLFSISSFADYKIIMNKNEIQIPNQELDGAEEEIVQNPKVYVASGNLYQIDDEGDGEVFSL